MTMLQGKDIILGVTGGIAAYKSVELLRLMKKADARVRVVMTRSAQWFVGEGTFRALSEEPVCTDLFTEGDDASIRHIDWAQEADAVVVAPATANIIGKLANGIADDALSTLMMAVTAPRMVCPSMNTHMYQSAAVQRNLEILKRDGFRVLEPGAGQLACGTTGPGRLPEPSEILDRLMCLLSPKDLAGQRVMVTAGPTREAIDPVRFITNHSSGKMGYAVARAAEMRGASVTLITGPTPIDPPNNMEVVRVEGAAEMAEAVLTHMDETDIIIKAAAVGDYRPQKAAGKKIKKTDSQMELILERTEDILKTVGKRKKKQFIVGFAAETEFLAKNAGKKLKEKRVDMIVGNIVGKPGTGFQAETNKVTLFFKDSEPESLDLMDKSRVADILLDRIAERIKG